MKYTIHSLAIAALLAASTAPALADQGHSHSQEMPMKGMSMEGKEHSSDNKAEGVGVVQAVDADKGSITLKHQAIESLRWPAMTMTFKVAEPEVLQGVKAGEQVRFGLEVPDNQPTVTWVKPATP